MGGLSAGIDDEQITRWALAAGRGDRDAASAFIRATQHQVRRYLHHLTGPDDLDDATQDTFLRALRSLPGFAGRSSARTWLFAIARRVAVDRVRTAMTRPRVASLDDWQSAADATDGAAGNRFDDDVVLRRLLDGLSPERREAFVTTQVLGLSYDEAAAVCDCPVGTIRSRVARARADLVAALAEADARPGGAGRTRRFRTAG